MTQGKKTTNFFTLHYITTYKITIATYKITIATYKITGEWNKTRNRMNQWIKWCHMKWMLNEIKKKGYLSLSMSKIKNIIHVSVTLMMMMMQKLYIIVL